MEQYIKWIEETNETLLMTKENGVLTVEPLTSEQAAQWTAENKY